MSKRTLRLAGLTFIALTLMVLGTVFAPAAQADCMDVVVYATNPATGECIQTNPCDVPHGASSALGGSTVALHG